MKELEGTVKQDRRANKKRVFLMQKVSSYHVSHDNY